VPGDVFGPVSEETESMVMGPERTGPKIECNANYRPVLSSERERYSRTTKFSDQEKKMKNLVMGPKGGSD
jgi:hypothetical protein